MKKLVAVLVSVFVLGLVFACAPNYSNGERVGIITKFSQKGLFFKSWEGELLMALPIEVAGTTQPESFAFTASPEVVDQVLDAMKTSKRVTVVYHQWFAAPLTIDTQYVVTEVK